MKFYKIMTDVGLRSKFAYATGFGSIDEKINCSVCGREWFKTLWYNEDNTFELVLSKENFSNFLGCVNYVLVSDDTKMVLTQEFLTGYHLVKASILSMDDLSPEQLRDLKINYTYSQLKKFAKNPPTYHKLFIDGKAELHEKAGVVLVEYCEHCGYKRYDIPGSPPFYMIGSPKFIKKESWDGSDFFHVKEFHTIYCSERFYEVYKKHNLTGLIFEEVEAI